MRWRSSSSRPVSHTWRSQRGSVAACGAVQPVWFLVGPSRGRLPCRVATCCARFPRRCNRAAGRLGFIPIPLLCVVSHMLPQIVSTLPLAHLNPARCALAVRRRARVGPRRAAHPFMGAARRCGAAMCCITAKMWCAALLACPIDCGAAASCRLHTSCGIGCCTQPAVRCCNMLHTSSPSDPHPEPPPYQPHTRRPAQHRGDFASAAHAGDAPVRQRAPLQAPPRDHAARLRVAPLLSAARA